MNCLTKAIFWLVLALIMVFCCVIDVINHNWFALVVCISAFGLDIVNASTEFSAWSREQDKKDTRKTEKHKK